MTTVKSCLAVLLIVILGTFTEAQAQQQQQYSLRPLNCPGPRVRRAWQDLTSEEQAYFVSAVRRLKELGLYDDFTWTHIVSGRLSHGVPSFLPWHRWFLYQFETYLQRMTRNCDLTVPYWDWSRDVGNEASSSVLDVFGSSFLGPIDRNNLLDGTYSPQQRASGCRWPLLSNRGGWEGCLERSFNRRYQFWGESQVWAMIADYTQFGDDFLRDNSHRTNIGWGDHPDDPDDLWMQGVNGFRVILEGGPHAAPHNFLGGIMTGMTSPNDPLFMLHHSNVDRIWALWQDYHGHSWLLEDEEYVMANWNATDLTMYEGNGIDRPMMFSQNHIRVNFTWFDSNLPPTPRQVLTLNGRIGINVQYVHGGRHPIPGHCPHPDWFRSDQENIHDECDSRKLGREEQVLNDGTGRIRHRDLSLLDINVESRKEGRHPFLRNGSGDVESSQQKRQKEAAETAIDVRVSYCQTEWNTFSLPNDRERWNRWCEILEPSTTIAERLTLMALEDCEERGNPRSASDNWIKSMLWTRTKRRQDSQDSNNNDDNDFHSLSLVQAEKASECFYIPDDYN